MLQKKFKLRKIEKKNSKHNLKKIIMKKNAKIRRNID